MTTTRYSALILLAAGLATLLAGCRDSAPREQTPPPTVSVARLTTRSLEGDFSASGRLIPREEVAVSPEVSGYRVARVLVEEDARVRQAEPLVLLDQALLAAQVAQARAQLDQQQAQLDGARMDAARVQGLDNEGVLSQEAIDQRRIAARNAQAAVAVAKAQLDDLLVRQQRMMVRAPVGGRVLQRSVRPGDTSATGTPMFTIARGNLVELEAEVPEAALARLTIGDPAKVTIAAGQVIDGQVRLLGARVNQQTGLSSVRIALPVNDALRPGGFAEARFVKASAPVLAAPDRAVHYDADGAYMLLLDKADRVRRASVRTGRRANGMVEILSGARAGDRAVLGGAAFVLQGDKVRIAEDVR